VGRFGFTIKHFGPSIFKNASGAGFLKEPITFEAERGGLKQTSESGYKSTGTYLRLVFRHTVVAVRSLAGGIGPKTEEVELAFNEVEMTYRQVIDGKLGPAITKSFDAKSKKTA